MYLFLKVSTGFHGYRIKRTHLIIKNKKMKIKGAVVVDTARCKGCALCVQACPNGVLALVKKKVNAHGYPYVEPQLDKDCIGCSSCAIVCPDACITVYRKKVEI